MKGITTASSKKVKTKSTDVLTDKDLSHLLWWKEVTIPVFYLLNTLLLLYLIKSCLHCLPGSLTDAPTHDLLICFFFLIYIFSVHFSEIADM